MSLQISYSIGQETQAGSLSMQDTAAHRNIAAALDLYTKVLLSCFLGSIFLQAFMLHLL